MEPGRARGLKAERRASAALGVSAADSIANDGQHAVASVLKGSRDCTRAPPLSVSSPCDSGDWCACCGAGPRRCRG